MAGPEGKEEACGNCNGLEKVPCPECFGNLEDMAGRACDNGEVSCPECT